MMKFKIIVDSMCTIMPEFAKEHDITILPYIINDLSGNLVQDEMNNKQKDIILSNIEKGIVYKTSFIANGYLKEVFDKYVKKYDLVIYITSSTHYTGQYDSVKVLEKEYDGKLQILNSNAIASTIESLVHELIWKINNKKLNKEDLNDIAEDVANRSVIFFAPKNVIGILHSGRAPSLIIKAMKLTKTYTIIKTEEKNKACGVLSRKWDEIPHKMFEITKKVYQQNISGNNIEFIYLYVSLLSQDEINILKKEMSLFFKIEESLIIVRDTPLPILVYTLRASFGIGITTKDIYKK